MQDLNQTILIGRLTRDCELKFTQSERAYTYASIAVNGSKKDGNGNYVDDPSFFEVQIWGKMAQNLCQYLTKGKQIAVVAHLHQDRWEKDGQKQSRVAIIADSVQLIGGNKSGDSAPHSEPAPSANEGGFHGTTANSEFLENTGSDFPEDIPF